MPRSTVIKGLISALVVTIAAWGGAKGWHAYQLRDQADEIVALSGLRSAANFREKIGGLRAFINDSSQHRQDNEFYATWRDTLFLAQRLVGGAKDKTQDRVHLECSTRTALMTLALEAAGFTTRRIDIYDSANLKSHTFVDVLNPETGGWETQDPDYDIWWRDVKTGKPVSIAETATDLAAVEPCGRTACGWDIASRERFKAAKLKDYLDFVTVKSKTQRFALYTPRADQKTVYDHEGKRGAFCDVLAENCRDGFFDMRAKDKVPKP